MIQKVPISPGSKRTFGFVHTSFVRPNGLSIAGLFASGDLKNALKGFEQVVRMEEDKGKW